MAAGPGKVRDALSAAADALAAAGVGDPRVDAEVLLAEAVGVDRARLAAEPEAVVDAPAGRRYGTMVRRRVAREPVAYVIGRRGFRRLELAVDPRVLIPRPETELLVEVALDLDPASVLDVGTGSGAVALAVAAELPGTAVVASDDSLGALDLARANAGRLGLAGRVRFEPGTVPPEERFDLVLANLPYVAAAEWERLEPEITAHEPRHALVAGPTGLEAIESLLESLAAGRPPGAVALEVGAGQAGAVSELVRGIGYPSVSVRRDLAGIDRVVVGTGDSG